MTLAVGFDLNPAVPTDSLVVLDDGHIMAKGNAIDPHVAGTFEPHVGKAIQVIDWTTPSGWTLDGFGGLHAFGSASEPGSGTWYTKGWDFYRAFSMNPDGSGEGYVARLDGQIKGVGGKVDVGTNEWPGRDVVRGLVMKWDTSGTVPVGAYYILTLDGGVHPRNGAKTWADNDTGGQQPNRDVARGLMVLDWEDPTVYWLSGDGGVHRCRYSIPVAATVPYWPSFSPAMAIRPVSESPLVYVVLDWNAVRWQETPSTPPTVTITAYTASGTTRPSVVWSVSDAQNDRIDHVTARLFTAAVAGAAGFDARTSTDFLFEDTVTSMAILGAVSDVSVPDGDYVWAVWATEAVTALASAVATQAFTLTVPRPGAPTVTASMVTGEPANGVTIVPAESEPAGAVYDVETSDDGGVTWAAWSASGDIAATGSSAVLTDRTAPLGVQRSYRARVSRPDVVIDGPWSAVVSATVQTTAGYWLSKFTGGVWGVPVEVKVKDIAPTDRVTVGVFNPVGWRNAVVVRDVPKGADLAVELWLLSTGERHTVEALVLGGAPLLLRDHFGHVWFLALSGDVARSLVVAAAPAGSDAPVRDAQTMQLQLTEVDAP